MLSSLQLFSTLWTVAHQAPLSVGFPRQEYWSGLLLASPGDFPYSGLSSQLLCLLHWQADSLLLCHFGSPIYMYTCKNTCIFHFTIVPLRCSQVTLVTEEYQGED